MASESRETGLLTGWKLPENRRKELYKLLGRELSPEVWEYQITGHRVLIVPEAVSERTRGLLYKPRSAVEREQLAQGAGWVIAVGPLVGQPGAGYPGGVLCGNPQDLLGCHVVWSRYTGVNLKTSEEDTEFGGNYSLLVMTDRDLLAVREGV